MIAIILIIVRRIWPGRIREFILLISVWQTWEIRIRCTIEIRSEHRELITFRYAWIRVGLSHRISVWGFWKIEVGSFLEWKIVQRSNEVIIVRRLCCIVLRRKVVTDEIVLRRMRIAKLHVELILWLRWDRWTDVLDLRCGSFTFLRFLALLLLLRWRVVVAVEWLLLWLLRSELVLVGGARWLAEASRWIAEITRREVFEASKVGLRRWRWLNTWSEVGVARWTTLTWTLSLTLGSRMVDVHDVVASLLHHLHLRWNVR